MRSPRTRSAARPSRALLRARTALALCVLLAGCFAYRSGQVPSGRALGGAAQASARTIAVSVTAERKVNGEMREFPERVREAWISATLQAYRDTGLFSEVRRGIGS